MKVLALLCLVCFAQTVFAQQSKVTVILGRDDIQCTSDNPFPCQKVFQVDESEARSELARLEKLTNPTREEIKLGSALNLSLGVQDAVREPQFLDPENEIKRGVRKPLQEKRP